MIDCLEKFILAHTKNYEKWLVCKHITCSAYSGVCISYSDYLFVVAYCVLQYLTELTCVSFDTMLGTWRRADKY